MSDKPPSTPSADGFANFVGRMGLGPQNILSQGTYTLDLLTRNRVKLEAMYRGSWIVGAAVDSVAEDMTRAGISINASIPPEQAQALEANLSRLGVWQSLLSAIKWGRLYGGAIAAIIIDGQDPATPLRLDTVGRGQFRGIKVYDRWRLQVDTLNTVEEGLNEGSPAFYRVVSDINTGATSGLQFHHSRVVRFVGIELPAYQAITEQLWGESIIERLYDRLVSFDTATAGAANLVSKAHLRTVQVHNLREVISGSQPGEQTVLKMFELMNLVQNNQGLTLLDANDVFSAHSYSFAGLSDMILQFGQQIAGATGIPLVRLFGQSPAGLNSTGESDLRMYYDNISARQESGLRDGLLTILRVLHQSLFGLPAPTEFDFDFVPLWQTSQKEKAEIAEKIANLIGVAYEKGIINQATALQELKQAASHTGVFSNISEEEIEEAKFQPPPMPEGATPEEVAVAAEPEDLTRV